MLSDPRLFRCCSGGINRGIGGRCSSKCSPKGGNSGKLGALSSQVASIQSHSGSAAPSRRKGVTSLLLDGDCMCALAASSLLPKCTARAPMHMLSSCCVGSGSACHQQLKRACHSSIQVRWLPLVCSRRCRSGPSHSSVPSSASTFCGRGGRVFVDGG